MIKDMQQAYDALKKKLPEGSEIIRGTVMGDKYVFIAVIEDDLDPYYSVNMRTGEVKEFSVVKDTTPMEVTKAFAARSQEFDKE